MDTPLLEDIVLAGVELGLEDLHTAQVGIVKSFNELNHTVEVQPMVKRAHTNEAGEQVEENQPVIPNVPVLYQGSGGHRTVFPVEKGSLVLLVHLAQSKDSWHFSRGASTVPPGDTRRHALTDCVAIPGLLTISGTISLTSLIKSGATVIYAPKLYLGGGLLTSPIIRKQDFQVLAGLLTTAAAAMTGSNPLGAAAVTAVASAINAMLLLLTTTVEAT